ncbi:hypothetical protein AAFF_G00260160 [Aldrovandia affinis]|uniref:Uncharacterized protein n=1 Tax=Aldrovandia affinis TaxID=143900 RepID=A0AAD7RCA3_9TELE|nr:hypothetical protein AAFF_G00260160 [Aldrovandia affinis]
MALNMELQQRQTEQEKVLAQRDDVSSQLQEVNHANSRLLEQVTELGQEKDKLQQELEETRKTADKRQAMLDELAIDVAQEKSRHKEELSDAWLQHEKEVLGVRARYEKELCGLHEDKNRTEEEIRSQLRDEKARTRELESMQQTVEKLQAQIQSMEGTKGWFERRLKEADETAEKSALEHQEQCKGKSFRWLLEKDVGYTLYLIKKVEEEEEERTGQFNPEGKMYQLQQYLLKQQSQISTALSPPPTTPTTAAPFTPVTLTLASDLPVMEEEDEDLETMMCLCLSPSKFQTQLSE